MCRLYGFLATAPTRLDCSLVAAQNALRVQSERDGRGRPNPDGWGIARWATARPEVVRSTRPAFVDETFAVEAEATVSRTVIAHVRAATVGDVDLDSVHPFRHGPWAFAHNGTLTAHAELGPVLLRFAHRQPRGTTDSELIFRWLLGRMPEFGLSPETRAFDVEPVARLLESALLDLVRASRSLSGHPPPKLNFMLSDGSTMAATRWGNSLHWTVRNGARDCTWCSNSHCPDADPGYRAVVIASEPITDEPWQEVQEGTVLAVDRDARLSTRDLLTRAA